MFQNKQFEAWLDANGYFYIKTKNNTPCFKSKLTQKLKEKFQEEMRNTTSNKCGMFSFKYKM
jgi:hypothetical protein